MYLNNLQNTKTQLMKSIMYTDVQMFGVSKFLFLEIKLFF